MRVPDRFNPGEHPIEDDLFVHVPDVPTVYPIDDEVTEGLLGPDGEPVSAGTRRKHPIGFTRKEAS